MTDLREALERASGVSDTAQPDHGAIGRRTQQIVRRRRMAYSALSVVAIAVVGFSALQVAEGNWFGDKQEDGGITAPAAAPAILHIVPADPESDDEITVRLESEADHQILYGQEYRLEMEVDGVWTDITGKVAFPDIGYILDPGETSRVAVLEPLAAGTYRYSKGVGRNERVSTVFTVAPAPQTEAPIEITAPADGDIVTSPVTVAGTADVFEANVSIRVLDENDEVITETFTTATCGNGCRGDYSEQVEFTVDREQAGTIEVFSQSAETGEDMFLETVSVTLMPSEAPAEETPPAEEQAAIEVLTPSPDAVLTSSVLISGTANVFEANVSIRILGENGEILKETFTTATCGTGCRGTFRKNVKFEVDHEQAGTIQVYEASAENGEPLNMVEIPVTLSVGD